MTRSHLTTDPEECFRVVNYGYEHNEGGCYGRRISYIHIYPGTGHHTVIDVRGDDPGYDLSVVTSTYRDGQRCIDWTIQPRVPMGIKGHDPVVEWLRDHYADQIALSADGGEDWAA